jgi:cyclopropane fatty-acyl-phospholipid synthase-like methyltransferase
MKPQTTEDVFDLIDFYITSAAVGTAMELGLFWLLDERPMDIEAIADKLQIPPRRCHYWLEHIRSTGLLEREEDGYISSTVARSAILDSYSRGTWTFLARESRERFPAMNNLTEHIRNPGSTWKAQGLKPPNYVEKMIENPERAEQFTRMLYELHQSFAEDIARNLDLSGAERLLDLGGGSGVISHALLRQYGNLTSLIVDIPNVCSVGRVIAEEQGLEERLTYMEANFLEDELPSGFDIILQCDVGEYDDQYLRKLWSTQESGGRLIMVEQFESEDGAVPQQSKYWAFPGSMADPEYSVGTLADLIAGLEGAGYRVLAKKPLSTGDGIRWDQDWILVEAVKE